MMAYIHLWKDHIRYKSIYQLTHWNIMCESGVKHSCINTLAAELSSCPSSFVSTRHPRNGRSCLVSTLCPPGYDNALQQLSSSGCRPTGSPDTGWAGKEKDKGSTHFKQLYPFSARYKIDLGTAYSLTFDRRLCKHEEGWCSPLCEEC